MSVEIQFASPDTSPDGLPIFRVGETLRGQLTLTPDRHAHTRGLHLRIDCTVHGAGSPEQVTLQPETLVYTGDLLALEPIHVPFEATIPATGPLSYQGRRVQFDWAVTLRVDVPFWADQRLSFPFLVLPRRAGQASAWDPPAGAAAAADAAAEPERSIWDDTPAEDEG